ncbi:MAG: ATPase family associated with various cellular [Myxococcaceae bacterium]|jgi:MoxR-like ATPase|nr:ATPase family associated with various cellular [Myxococcaceae bacterium]
MQASHRVDIENDHQFPNGSVAKPVVGREIRELEQRIEQAARWVVPLRREMGRVVVGQRALVDRLLIGLLTNGHILVEGVPGLAKTLALKTLANAVHGTKFSRIQFTPDMLPSDITGTTIYHAHSASFETKHGPIFGNLVLADEINRAPAKVQSALLEAMQERQVTLGDESYALPDPFMVLATQNPLEQEGTYPLPEAQIDRFMLKVLVQYPSGSEERAILDAMAVNKPRLDVSPVVSIASVLDARRVVDEIYVDDAVRDYIVRIVLATRNFGKNSQIHGLLRAGASPRATIALTLAARASAFLQGRGYVVPEDVKMLAPDVLRHRLALSFAAEAEGIDGDEIVRRVLHAVVSP